MLLLTNKAE